MKIEDIHADQRAEVRRHFLNEVERNDELAMELDRDAARFLNEAEKLLDHAEGARTQAQSSRDTSARYKGYLDRLDRMEQQENGRTDLPR